MNRGLLFLALIFVAASATEAKDEGNVGDMMERTHKGRRSPYRLLEQQLEAKAPQWPAIKEQLPAFGKMAETLQKSRKEEVRDSADGYVDAVNELTKAAKGRNLVNFRKGFESLKSSCAIATIKVDRAESWIEMVGMENRPFQFTLKRLLMATAFVAGACSVARWALRGVIVRDPMRINDVGELGLLGALFVVGVLLGAAVGALGGSIRIGVAWGIVGTMAVILFFGVCL